MRKIVYNSKGYGLKLTADEMRFFAATLGFKLRQHNKGSNETWFTADNCEAEWYTFRCNALLVGMVERSFISNPHLRVVEVPDDAVWNFNTDWETFERITYCFDDEYDEYDEYDAVPTQGQMSPTT